LIRESHILLFSIFIAGLCSIIYELLIATTGSYFLGNSITQFSITIGVYMATMGIGSYLSKWIKDESLLAQFICFELILAIVGGSSVPVLYFSYAYDLPFQMMSILLTAFIGVLVGLEVPLLTRLMEKHYSLKANLANVLSLDYFGALIATLIFPLLLLPWLGVFKTSLFFGLINLSIALTLLWYFFHSIPLVQRTRLRFFLVISIISLVGLMVFSSELSEQWNDSVYEDRIVHSQQTPYQQIVMTRHKDDVRLYLNGGLQFSSIDEYRYHESLVHPAMSRLHKAKSILILGGGDGLAVRELLKYPGIESITVVDLDPAMVQLAKNNHYLKALNNSVFFDERVNVEHQDAFVFLSDHKQLFDLIIIDLPDPKTISLARLYSKQFYQIVHKKLSANGVMVTQATSPFFANKAFWSIHNTVAAVGFKQVMPYHVDIPSFGDWGFVLACKNACKLIAGNLPETRFYSHQLEPALTLFPADINKRDSTVSKLDKPSVLYYYLAGWKYWS